MGKKKYLVSVQASATIQFRQTVEADSPEAAKGIIAAVFKKLDSGMISQIDGELSYGGYVSADKKEPAVMYFQISEAPKVNHDYYEDDIEVEVEE